MIQFKYQIQLILYSQYQIIIIIEIYHWFIKIVLN